MDVPNQGAGGKPVERLGGRIWEFAEQTVDVEWQRRHPLGDLALPVLAWAVPVDLDSVAVGIREVDRLADVVVGEALERDAVAGGMREPAGEIGALRHEQREVVEAGIAVGGARAVLLHQDEHGALAAPERKRALALLERLEADGCPVVGERLLEIRDGQVYGSEPGQRRELRGSIRCLRLEFLGVARRRAPRQLQPLLGHDYCS